MLKQIIGQVIYQVAILSVLMFAGENFLPEYSDAFDDEINKRGLDKSVKYNGGLYSISVNLTKIYLQIMSAVEDMKVRMTIRILNMFSLFLQCDLSIYLGIWSIKTFHHNLQYFCLDEFIQFPEL